MRQITSEDIAFVRKPWVWDLGNQVLYDLCSTHPSHKTDDEIIAKVWLIGRSYAAPIERRKNVLQIGDDFYEKTVAPTLRNSDIDSWLSSISQITAPGSAESIVVHKRLMSLFESITGHENRSLASKYLHFHQPSIFYIYDSRVRQAITKVVLWLNSISDIQVVEYDQEYKDFVRRCIWLRDHVQNVHGTLLTPREIDKMLLSIMNNELKARR